MLILAVWCKQGCKGTPARAKYRNSFGVVGELVWVADMFANFISKLEERGQARARQRSMHVQKYKIKDFMLT